MSSLSDKNYKKAAWRIIDSIKLKCKKCNGTMVRCIDLDSNEAYDRNVSSDQTIVGYSCEDCPHYYLFH